ncbi:MAG: glycine--tRNA ligase subunit beta [Legionellales bacterium]|nr:glycine--tRNA ligase subunit beta [Legionellales bacterium]
MTSQNLLIECITEELPPGQIVPLSEALCSAVTALLERHQIPFSGARPIGAPRHLGVLVENCGSEQPPQQQLLKGPAIKAAKTPDGQWTPAAKGFAQKCGCSPDELQEIAGKLAFNKTQPSQSLSAVLQAGLTTIFDGLPVTKRMRWSDLPYTFARPVHGLVVLHGSTVLSEVSLYGHQASNQTIGHRFWHPAPVTLENATSYEEALLEAGVIVNFKKRRNEIEKSLKNKAKSLNLLLNIDQKLLDEVTNLVEWPQVLAATFDAKFLSLPAEVPIIAMQAHQRYFPLFKDDSSLSNQFLVVSNSRTSDVKNIIDGNERVVRARLHDADFFFKVDQKTSLESRLTTLDRVVFQHKLGSMGEKTRRLAQLTPIIAKQIGADPDLAQRAASLCKADLVTQMVGEFPELQGFMGGQYASLAGENAVVAEAIESHYKPAFAKDVLPPSLEACAVSLADKVDTLVGIFGIGMKPTGNKDPFALRRQMLGLLRICVENQLDIDFETLIEKAFSLYEVSLADASKAELLTFAKQRFLAWYSDQGVGPQVVNSVLATGVSEPYDIGRRIEAIQAFIQLPQAPALSAANKRVSNLLQKSAEGENVSAIQPEHLVEAPEKALFESIVALQKTTAPLVTEKNYTQVLKSLAEIEPMVDEFFEQVMVMVDDAQLRSNRLGLLNSLRALFLQVADISELSV